MNGQIGARREERDRQESKGLGPGSGMSEHTQDRLCSGNKWNRFSFSFDPHSSSQEALY